MAELEYSSPRTKVIYLTYYVVLSTALSFYNNAVLKRLPFPWLLTTIQTFVTVLGCVNLMFRGSFRLSDTWKRNRTGLLLFAFLFTISIAISHASMSMVSISFHQCIRATTPLFVVVLNRVVYGRRHTKRTYLSVVVIVIGVVQAFEGAYSFTSVGCILTIIGVITAAFKTVITNILMTKSKSSPSLAPMESLLCTSLVAAPISLVAAIMMGEVTKLQEAVGSDLNRWMMVLAELGANGVLAFFLSAWSFKTNKVAGALSMSVAGNIKSIFTIVCAVVLFDTELSLRRYLGISIVCLGTMGYCEVEILQRWRRSRNIRTRQRSSLELPMVTQDISEERETL